MRALEVYLAFRTEEAVPVWVDPYSWVDPFAEAEHWAIRWAYERFDRDKELRDMRDAHRRETHHLRAQLEGLLRAVAIYTAGQPFPIVIVKDPDNAG